MLWAQIMPFVALQLSEDSNAKGGITLFLVCSFGLWLLLNVIFFCTIDLSYLSTFFGTMTAPQYACELFKLSENDSQRFNAVFSNYINYTSTIHEEVKWWVAQNIESWENQGDDWFKVEMIPDELLPRDAYEAAGGTSKKRRKRSISVREIVGLGEKERKISNATATVHPE